jgi:hypothetical protein
LPFYYSGLYKELKEDIQEKQKGRQMKRLIILLIISMTTGIIKAEENKTRQAVRPLSLREKLNSLTYTPAVKELGRDRRRASLGGMFLGQKNGTVGYRPTISVLPQGNSMTTGIVVSPDRRYVRIGILFIDTSIGSVHTFNFSTGEAQSFNKR